MEGIYPMKEFPWIWQCLFLLGEAQRGGYGAASEVAKADVRSSEKLFVSENLTAGKFLALEGGRIINWGGEETWNSITAMSKRGRMLHVDFSDLVFKNFLWEPL